MKVLLKIKFIAQSVTLKNSIMKLTQPKNDNSLKTDGEFKCLKDGFFINLKYVCDGFFDCFDKSDEKNCSKSNDSYFLCHDKSKLIGIQLVCDFVYDCPDDSDELHCGLLFPFFSSFPIYLANIIFLHFISIKQVKPNCPK